MPRFVLHVEVVAAAARALAVRKRDEPCQAKFAGSGRLAVQQRPQVGDRADRPSRKGECGQEGDCAARDHVPHYIKSARLHAPGNFAGMES